MNYIDYIVMAAFFAVLFLIPAISAMRSKSKGANEYFKSAGSMPWWLIGISMVAATTSTNSANLFTEIIREDGLSGNWAWWAFLLTGMLTVFVYSKLWVRSGATTDISFYELRYSGKPAAFLRGFRAIYLGVIYNLVVTATVLLGAVKIGVVLFGISPAVILTVTAVVSIIYTRGSTGTPKGVELTHRNMLSQILVIKRDFLYLNRTTDVGLVVLPVAHAFERMSVYFYTLCGIKIYFADNPRHIAECIKEVCPTVMTVVPRILERLYESMTSAGERIYGVQKFIFEHAISYAKKHNPMEKGGIFSRFYDRVVFEKMRKAMGGRFRLVISGGGALNKSICRFLLNVGFNVCEGYGLTECSPVVSVNKLGSVRPGSVGLPLTHLQVKIGEQSEVLVKGDSVFKGYRNRPDLNAEIFTTDGFFRTGDQGHFDADGYLYLTGRLKELFKTSTGKYVSPNPIELELGRHLLVEQALVIANGRKFVSALIFLNPVNAKRFLQRTGKTFSVERALKSKRIRESIDRHVERVNAKLNHWEQIRKWTLVGDELTVESGLLTPTLKIRRTVAEARYAEEIEKMYQG